MNEREFTLRVVIALSDTSPPECVYIEAEAYVAEARKRGLFDDAEAERMINVSAVAAYTAESENEQLNAKLDEARKLVAEMQEFIRATPLPSEKAMLQKHRDGGWSMARGMLIAKAKEMTSD